MRLWFIYFALAFVVSANEPEFRTFVEIEQGGICKIVPAELVKSNSTPMFKALTAMHWPAGYVPVFAVEREKSFELRRRAPRGQENFTEPAFFGLPLTTDTNALYSGRWIVEATREDGSKPFLAWDLAVEEENVSGRLDQDTDYRHAFVTGGKIKASLLELNIDYINDKFLIIGTVVSNRLTGSWSKLDKSESGTLVAFRPPFLNIRRPSTKLVKLHPWESKEAVRYRPEGIPLPAPWQKQEAICLVWQLN